MLYFAAEETENPPRLSSPTRAYDKSKMKMNTEWSEVEILFHDQNFSKFIVYKYKFLGDLDGKGFNFDYFSSKGCIRSMQ
jgi:hypothetical protein